MESLPKALYSEQLKVSESLIDDSKGVREGGKDQKR